MKARKHNTRPNRLSRFFLSALTIILATSLFVPLNLQIAFAEPTSAEVQAQVDEASAQLALAEEELFRLGQEYTAAVEAHDQALASMEEAEARIAAAEEIIASTQERLGTRAAQMYRQGPFSFLEVLFGATSFEQFATGWELINVINRESAQLIQTNKDARAEAATAYEELAVLEKTAADKEVEAEEILARAEVKIAAQEAELDALSAEVAALVDQEQAARQEARQEESAQQYPNYNGSAPEVPSGGYADVVSAAMSRIGCPYYYGGTGPDMFDCSGFTQWCYATAGRGWIGRGPADQYNNATARWPYANGGAEPGDVLWWTDRSHVSLYVGGGQYIHAPLPGQTVCYSNWEIEKTIVLRF